jgi:hypothetical protein
LKLIISISLSIRQLSEDNFTPNETKLLPIQSFFNGWVANYKVIKGASKAAKLEFLRLPDGRFLTEDSSFWGLESL